MSLAGEAQAERSWGATCGSANCHVDSQEALTVTNNDDTIDLGLGELKVFNVEPDGGVNLTSGVVNFYAGKKYAVSVDDLGALPLSSSAGWSRQNGFDGSEYYATGYSTSNNNWTYQLAVGSGAAEGYYLFEFSVKGFFG